MNAVTVSGTAYALDRRGFLADPSTWDLDFAAAMARRLEMPGELTLLHLKVLLFVHRFLVNRGRIPRLFETCRGCDLTLARLRELFPLGYQRGVCRLAGIPYHVIDTDHHALTYETVYPQHRDDDRR